MRTILLSMSILTLERADRAQERGLEPLSCALGIYLPLRD